MMQEYIQKIILTAPPILMALTVHEFAHAWMADRLGDPTARMLGRVTLNPFRHLDPIGTIMLFFSGLFGWAKPVPVNARNFKNPSSAMMWVALAGPMANLALATVSALVYKAFLMGSLDFLPPGVFRPLFIMTELSVIINISLAVFNLVPIPPLDGSRVLQHLLPANRTLYQMERYGFLILLVLIATGALNRFISPLVFLMVGLLTGGA